MVSVIIPTFNRANYIKRAVDSVLNQTFKDFELIIVDDSSNDNTQDILSNYKDSRIKIIVNSVNKGVSYSRNIAIKNSQYELISFLDSDDEWKRDKLKTQVDFFKKNKDCKIHQCEEIWIKNNKFLNKKLKHTYKEGYIFYQSLHLCLISPSSVMLKKELFDEFGYFDEEFEVCEDYDLWLRITRKYPVCFSKEPLVIKYGGHSDQLSVKYFAMDRWRVKSILKILDDSFDKKVFDVANKKVEILINGAKKHNNKEILEEANMLKIALKEIYEKSIC